MLIFCFSAKLNRKYTMSYRKSRAILYRNILPVLIGGVVLITGCLLLYISAANDKETSSKNSNVLIEDRLNTMLGGVAKATRNASYTQLKNCTRAQPILQDQLFYLPVVRSISLLNKQNEIFCSTAFKDDGADYALPFTLDDEHALFLHKGSPRIPNIPAIHYLSRTQNGSVLASLDAKNVVQLIDPEEPGLKFFLSIGDAHLDESGIFGTQTVTPDHLFYAYTQSSNRFPFKITTGYSKPLTLSDILKNKKIHLSFIVLIAIIAAFAGKFLSQYVFSPSFDIKRALRQGEIVPYIQPIVDARSRRIIGLEVLARWKHPKDGLISPDYFIPMAEKTGLIKDISRHLMKKVALVFAPYKSRLSPEFHIGFNVAAAQLTDTKILEDCRNFIDELAPAAFMLILEITERELIPQTEESKTLFQQLHKMGIKIALDDFGVGNSSLSYLNYFEIDLLKIDKIFVDKIQNEAIYLPILDTIIDLSQKIGLGTVAEGVETELQVTYLLKKNVTHLQGYYFGKPMPIE